MGFFAVCEQTCDRTCPFGFKMEGCPRCECSPDPCYVSFFVGYESHHIAYCSLFSEHFCFEFASQPSFHKATSHMTFCSVCHILYSSLFSMSHPKYYRWFHMSHPRFVIVQSVFNNNVIWFSVSARQPPVRQGWRVKPARPSVSSTGTVHTRLYVTTHVSSRDSWLAHRLKTEWSTVRQMTYLQVELTDLAYGFACRLGCLASPFSSL